ncbi:hypothetical protein ACQQ2N_21290 [Dokdonella sp. MW10]|uniref:hypothetical protein n=1 Tax=Dokdonella sp. MW10 TaxID=2992926 RepID=UPI003F7F587B
MKIADISLADIRAGSNWRVTTPEPVDDDLPLEALDIELLGAYRPEDRVVYAGLKVHLALEGEPDGDARPAATCIHAPEDPAELRADQRAVVRPLLMIKCVEDTGWDYCEFASQGWRQVGLVRNPNPPFTHEYFADPLPDDAEFCIELESDGATLGSLSREGFRRWIGYLGA